jgi:hypothetical protein
MFNNISSINVSDTKTWKDKIFLTIDIDWVNDEILEDTINILESHDVYATWYVTHQTKLLDRLRENPKFELGIHPNFNWLLEGIKDNGANTREVTENLLKIVPEATSVRSHSMTQNSRILQTFSALGLTHDVNTFIPANNGVVLQPWLDWNGIIKIPYCWEDDVFCIYESIGYPVLDIQESVKQANGVLVFDFHPIHIFLNTEVMKRYEHSRNLHDKPIKLIRERYDGFGTRDRLLELLSQN